MVKMNIKILKQICILGNYIMHHIAATQWTTAAWSMTEFCKCLFACASNLTLATLLRPSALLLPYLSLVVTCSPYDNVAVQNILDAMGYLILIEKTVTIARLFSESYAAFPGPTAVRTRDADFEPSQKGIV